MQYKLRNRVDRYKRAIAAAAASVADGIERTAAVPLLSSQMPSPTPTLTFTPSPTPTTTGPTPTPTSTSTSTPTPTPTRTPTPTPTLNFSFTGSFKGPGESESLVLFIPEDTTGSKDVIFVNSYESKFETYQMNVYIFGQYRTTVDYDSGRAGTQFGYRRSSSDSLQVPEFIGVFPNISPTQSLSGGDVFFT